MRTFTLPRQQLDTLMAEATGADSDGVDAVVGQRAPAVEELCGNAAVDVADHDMGPLAREGTPSAESGEEPVACDHAGLEPRSPNSRSRGVSLDRAIGAAPGPRR